MRRVCIFGHPVLEDFNCCCAGHSLGASFECPVSDCIFVTKPTTLKNKVLAEEQLQLHLEATHDIEPTASEKEKIELGFHNFEKERLLKVGFVSVVEDEGLKIEMESKTCQFCYKSFTSKSNVKRHVKQEHLRKE